MKAKEQELIEKYLEFKKTEKEAATNASKTLQELSLMAPHQVGEIVKLTETERKRVGGTIWHPVYKEQPPVEKVAVLTSVKTSVWQWSDGKIDFRYNYDFSPIKKDGGISQQHCCPLEGFEWTGETHKED